MSERKSIDFQTGPVLLALWFLITMIWWGFAFLPATAVSSDWLARAQSACFGSMEDGMPAAYGWALLILAPGSFLVGLWAAYLDDLVIGFRQILRSPLWLPVWVVLLVGFAAEGVWVKARIDQAREIASAFPKGVDRGALPEGYAQGHDPMPLFELVNQFGERVTPQTFLGKVVVFTFAFAHCQTVCPMLVQNILAAYEKVDRSKVVIAIITLDPWRDTPAALPSLASKWELPSGAMVLSGEPGQVTAALDRFNVPWKRNEKSGDVSHPALVYVINQAGELTYAFNDPSIVWLTDAVHLLTQPQ